MMRKPLRHADRRPVPPPIPRPAPVPMPPQGVLAIWVASASLLSVPMMLVLLVMSSLGGEMLPLFWVLTFGGTALALAAIALGASAGRPLAPTLLSLPALLVYGAFFALLLFARLYESAQNTALHEAALDGDPAALEAALADEATLRDIDKPMKARDTQWDQLTALAIAVVRDDAAIARRLLERGASPNASASGGPVLLTAVRHNSPEMTEALIEAGAQTWGVHEYRREGRGNLVALALDNRLADSERPATDPERRRRLADNDRILAALVRSDVQFREDVIDLCAHPCAADAPSPLARWTAIDGDVRTRLCAPAPALGATDGTTEPAQGTGGEEPRRPRFLRRSMCRSEP